MADFDIDSVTRMLGREPDQEINGLHYEAVDRAARASGPRSSAGLLAPRRSTTWLTSGARR